MDKSIIPQNPVTPAVINAVESWAAARTDTDSPRRDDLIRDKALTLIGDGLVRRKGEIVLDASGQPKTAPLGFFSFRPIPINHVTAADVRDWQEYLENCDLSAGSVYSRVSRLSSFFDWLMDEPTMRGMIGGNPVQLARPKAPKPYQSENVKALTDKQARTLLKVVKGDADTGDIAAMRDYAMLRFYFATGKRRAEIANLHWRDVSIEGESLTFTTRHKGGIYKATEINDPDVINALYRYLIATGRWDIVSDTPDLPPDAPLWLRHDRAARPGQGMTSQGFVKALKGYAKRAGIGHIHLHQTRHTVARMVGEESGNLADVQTVLGHSNQATTRVYLDRVSVKVDKFSKAIGARLKVDE